MFPKGVPLFSGSKEAQYKLPGYGKKDRNVLKLDSGLLSHIKFLFLVFYRQSFI